MIIDTNGLPTDEPQPLVINATNYRGFPAISNSDLTELEKMFMPEERKIDLEKAYANGTLIDCMITEKERVNYFTLKVEGEPYNYTKEEFENSKLMKQAFFRDPFCKNFVEHPRCKFQHISYRPEFKITHEAIDFVVAAKCKWDLFREDIDLSGDIKSTACTTQKQVEEAVRYFAYDRSRAWYMDLEGRSNDILLFISKVNHQVFKVVIRRGDQLYKEGKAKYQALAFQHWCLFNDLKTA